MENKQFEINLNILRAFGLDNQTRSKLMVKISKLGIFKLKRIKSNIYNGNIIPTYSLDLVIDKFEEIINDPRKITERFKETQRNQLKILVELKKKLKEENDK